MMFSVVLPLYNKAQSIRLTADGVLKQSVKKFELIIVDDGSTDGSFEELADIRDDRLRIIRQSNRGVGLARNTGILAASGVWVAFIDADDFWHPDHLAELNRIALIYPDAGLISTANVEIYVEEIPIENIEESEAKIMAVDYFLEASRNTGFINSSSAAIRRSVFIEIGGFKNVRSGEDLEYWARIALHYTVAVSKKVTSFYCRARGGTMLDLHNSLHRARLDPVENIGQLSSSLQLLLEKSEVEPGVLTRKSVITYINSRIENGIRGALFRGDIRYARSLRVLLLPPVGWRPRFYAVATYFPGLILSLAIKIYRYVKSIFFIIKNQ